ncbi:hypothetical protein, partial [uncultured Allofournierella sp.]|uniref:hypothetical protein n=1 Tax=uncultured Allofournierella sp. TaxID=1940258 RepID=UPI0025CBD2A4
NFRRLIDISRCNSYNTGKQESNANFEQRNYPLQVRPLELTRLFLIKSHSVIAPALPDCCGMAFCSM